MAFDTFLKIDGIEGEATAEGMDGAIDIYSFSWGASNPVTIGAGTGGGAGKVSVSSFNVMKKTDKSSPSLFQKCCKGQHFDKAEVIMRKAGGDSGQAEFLKYEFEEVYVESIQWSGSSGGDDTPTESLSLAFGKCTITYQQQDKSGATGKPQVGSWDIRKVA